MAAHGGTDSMRALRYDFAAAMTRRSNRQTGVRARIAAAAARIMAEDGIDDFGLAKRKAARQLGADERQGLPANDEVEAELEAYRALYQSEEHPERIAELREVALDAMRAFRQFRPYLTGPVLHGVAGPYAEIELELFPESTKELEIFLMNLDLPFSTRESKRFGGDRTRYVSVFSLTWQGLPLKVSALDPRDERMALKTTQAGRPMERAGIDEVAKMVATAGKMHLTPANKR
jgi:hypothetical protein